MIFTGACPFVGCTDMDIHAHSECPDCGAANHGNTSCAICVQTWDIRPDTKATLLSIIEQNKGRR